VRVSVPTDVVERLRAWAETKPEIRALWIFGSAITEKPNPSDLDIAFDADPRPDLNTFVNKGRAAMDGGDRAVVPVPAAPRVHRRELAGRQERARVGRHGARLDRGVQHRGLRGVVEAYILRLTSPTSLP
jgi:hypothetical protein